MDAIRFSLLAVLFLGLCGVCADGVEAEAPTATIDSISPSPAFFGTDVIFNGTGSDSNGTIVAYEWQSDIDGNLSDQENFNITNLNIGNHTIFFRVQDNDGNWSNWTTAELVINSSLEIIANEPLRDVCQLDTIVSNFTVSNYGNDTTVLIEIPYQDVYENAGLIFAFNQSQWQIASGGVQVVSITIQTSANPSNLTSMYYNIIVKASATFSDVNETHTATSRLHVLSWGDGGCTLGAMPVAIAGSDLKNIEIGSVVQFAGAGTDEDGTIVKYEWDFDGDGIFEWSSEENGITTFIYNKAGIYSTTLRVTDSDGNNDTDSRSIEVVQGLTSSIPGLIIDAEAGLLIVATIGLIIAIFSRRD